MPTAPTSTMDAGMGPREQERDLLHEAADAVGALMEFWGFKRVMGRIWALFYLRGDELSASELCDQLSISSGAASMALAELEHWAVVRRIRRAGDRREYFEAETDVWKMISRALRGRGRGGEAGDLAPDRRARAPRGHRGAAGQARRPGAGRARAFGRPGPAGAR